MRTSSETQLMMTSETALRNKSAITSAFILTMMSVALLINILKIMSEFMLLVKLTMARTTIMNFSIF